MTKYKEILRLHSLGINNTRVAESCGCARSTVIGEDNFGCHNTDAHLRSSVIGRNVTIVAVDGEMDLGEFGRIHFIDWDQTRGRTRTVQVMIIGE